MRRALIAVLACAAAWPAAAQAVYFQAQPIDAAPDIAGAGSLDVARDGSGALAYVRGDGGTPHIFVSRLQGGAFLPPVRIDTTLASASNQPVVAASDGGRVTVVFTSGGAVYAVVRTAGAANFTAPQLIAGTGADPSVDMSIHGTAYASYTSAGDVRVARLDRKSTQYANLPDPIDIAQADDAGAALGRSRIATSADGTAVVVWGENGHVYGRRVFGDHISAAPQDLTVDQLGGQAGGVADSPAIDIEDDSSFAWATFREQFADGRAHIVARRLIGSQFEAPVAADGLGFGGDTANTTSVAINGRGEGILTSGSGGFAAWVALIHDDQVFPATQLSGLNLVDPLPVGDESENNHVYVAWLQGTPLATTVHANSFDIDVGKRTVPGPLGETQLSTDAFGSVDRSAGLQLAVNRVGDMLAVFVQDDGVTRRLVSAGFARPSGVFQTYTTTKWRRYKRPPLAWGESLTLWGPLDYQVEIDKQIVGHTPDTHITVATPLADGLHHWRILATDRHGQQTASTLRTLRVDATPPSISFTISGTRKRGRLLKVGATVSDLAGATTDVSRVKSVRIAFGDGTFANAARAAHAYRRGGHFTVSVSATDNAGNTAVVKRRVTIKK